MIKEGSRVLLLDGRKGHIVKEKYFGDDAITGCYTYVNLDGEKRIWYNTDFLIEINEETK